VNVTVEEIGNAHYKLRGWAWQSRRLSKLGVQGLGDFAGSHNTNLGFFVFFFFLGAAGFCAEKMKIFVMRHLYPNPNAWSISFSARPREYYLLLVEQGFSTADHSMSFYARTSLTRLTIAWFSFNFFSSI